MASSRGIPASQPYYCILMFPCVEVLFPVVFAGCFSSSFFLFHMKALGLSTILMIARVFYICVWDFFFFSSPLVCIFLHFLTLDQAGLRTG